MREGSGKNHLQIYRQLARLRNEESFRRGSMQYVVITDEVFSFVRHFQGHRTYIIAMNLGSKTSKDNYSVIIDGQQYEKATVELVCGGFKLNPGKDVDLLSIKLNPGEGIVLYLKTEA